MPVTYERARELALAPSAPSGSPTLDAHLAERPPTRLYHYTSADGLKGIMKSRTLFATNIMFMNDLTEVDHLLEHVENLQSHSHAQDTDRRRFIESITSTMHSAARRRYISSLSALSNSLSQWRGYCLGGGYAIGLPSKQLQLMASQQGYTLCKCIYDDSQKRNIVNEVVDFHNQRFQNFKEGLRMKRSSRLGGSLRNILFGLVRS